MFSAIKFVVRKENSYTLVIKFRTYLNDTGMNRYNALQ